MKLENISIVMVGTTHPGNIGAAARAMYNMGLSRMVLVDPQCPVGEVAYARASGANAVLDQRLTCDSLEQAVADCELSVAASARRRSLSWPELDPPQLVEKLLGCDDRTRVAIVFGREHSGLSNDELHLCNYMLRIPANPAFSSLNLAAAIQILGYEIYRHLAATAPVKPLPQEDRPATSTEVEDYFGHLEATLIETGFIDPEHPGLIMQRLRRLYLRSELSHNEVNILRGILASVTNRYKS